MIPTDFVYTQIYKGALRAGASERSSHANAVMGLDDFKKGRYKKPHKIITERINKAKSTKD